VNKIKNFFRSIKLLVASYIFKIFRRRIFAVKFVSDEEHDRRLDICEQCEHCIATIEYAPVVKMLPMMPEFMKHMHNCEKCGCVVEVKSLAVKSKCPLGLWAK
jgi:hypothetical protein